jgi:ornithine cyclodeaminase/alanine dehydrogenase-like protein (mu-crystallin family)
MTLILSNDDVEHLLTMREYIDVLEEAYLELAAGRGVSRTRSNCITQTSRPDAVYGLKSMDGVIPKFGIGAIRINSDIVTFPKRGNNLRREKVPASPGARYVGLVLLFSSENGEPLAILPDGVMQRMRVGATNGLGVKYLARADFRKVGILGSGWQAGSQLMAVCAVREVEIIRCFSPNPENREKFCREMSNFLGIQVIPVSQPEDAIGRTDVVMCASNSLDSIFFESWVEPGMHLSSIKRPEIDKGALQRVDRIVLHSHDETPIIVKAHDAPYQEKGKERGWANSLGIDLSKVPILPDLIAGHAPGRQNDREITCFMNNIGLGYQFAAAGYVPYRKAKEVGLGHDLPTDWFTETVHP